MQQELLHYNLLTVPVGWTLTSRLSTRAGGELKLGIAGQELNPRMSYSKSVVLIIINYYYYKYSGDYTK